VAIASSLPNATALIILAAGSLVYSQKRVARHKSKRKGITIVACCILAAPPTMLLICGTCRMNLCSTVNGRIVPITQIELFKK
jgi:hypothetical protein